MARTRLTRLISSSGDESRLRGPIDRSRLTGLGCVLVGLCQLPLANLYHEQALALFITASGGWLLVGIGMNLFRGKEAFDFGWSDSERVAWLSTVLFLLFGLFVVVATATVLS
jgi:predicted membrane channel-forming protein YqfA (hemolysin III family)